MKPGKYAKRTATGLVLFILITALVYMGGVYFLLLIGAISLAATRELQTLLAPSGLRIGRGILMAGSAVVLVAAYAGTEYFLIALYLGIMGVFTAHMIRGPEGMSGYVREVGTSLVTVALLAMMTGSAVLLRNTDVPLPGSEPIKWFFLKDELGFYLVGMAFLCGAANDSTAYFTGKWKGKTQLVPNISPRKTVEGAVAGVAASIVTAVLVNYVFGAPFSELFAVFCGLLAGLLSITGDLIESSIKRDCNAKDSGNLLPGHGGFFDRFDGMIFIFPAFYIIALLLN